MGHKLGELGGYMLFHRKEKIYHIEKKPVLRIDRLCEVVIGDIDPFWRQNEENLLKAVVSHLDHPSYMEVYEMIAEIASLGRRFKVDDELNTYWFNFFLLSPRTRQAVTEDLLLGLEKVGCEKFEEALHA